MKALIVKEDSLIYAAEVPEEPKVCPASERWKDIPGFESHYQVSNLGNVRSLDRVLPKGKFTYKQKGKIISPQVIDGYLSVKLQINGKNKGMLVHRLVAMAWIPNPNNKPCVNHLNSNRRDNRAENLEWCTHSENTIHGRQFGNIGPDAHNKGKWNNPVNCGTCGKLIRRKKPTTKFCSKACYGKHKSKLYANARSVIR